MTSSRWFWPAFLVLVIVVVVIVGGSGSAGPPLDPRSVAPDGARGVVEVLERFGADVELNSSVPEPSDETALLLVDRLTPQDEQALEEWVRSGGTLVVADQGSSFTADYDTSFASAPERNVCTIDALADVTEINIEWGNYLDAVGSGSCFGSSTSAFVVATDVGDGTVVSVGNPQVFDNEHLDDTDAAVLAVSLLVPRRGTSVTFIAPSVVPAGEETLNDLVAPRVYNAIYQLLAAFLLYGLFRARRLGKVVAEPLPVRLIGSELVLQSGVLSRRSNDPGGAAEVLRFDFITRTKRSFAIGAEATPEDVARVIATRYGEDEAQIASMLTRPITSEDDLVEMAHRLADLDDQILNPKSLNPDARKPDSRNPDALSPNTESMLQENL